MPAFVNAYYGSRDVGTIYGSLITAPGAAGFGAPLLPARIADTTGLYAPALYAADLASFREGPFGQLRAYPSVSLD